MAIDRKQTPAIWNRTPDQKVSCAPLVSLFLGVVITAVSSELELTMTISMTDSSVVTTITSVFVDVLFVLFVISVPFKIHSPPTLVNKLIGPSKSPLLIVIFFGAL